MWFLLAIIFDNESKVTCWLSCDLLGARVRVTKISIVCNKNYKSAESDNRFLTDVGFFGQFFSLFSLKVKLENDGILF
jgi:hypothetical protein